MRPFKTLVAAVAATVLAACAPELPVTDTRIGVEATTATEGTTAASSSEPELASSPDGTSSSAEASSTVVGEGCLARAESLSVEQRVGQLYMMGVSTGGLDEATRATITGNSIGAVVLLGNTTSGAGGIRMLTAELGSLSSAELPLLVAVDQEGGSVQRLKGIGFSDMPNARAQGDLPAGDLAHNAEIWGQELHGAGVLYNLAPVGDVVPVDRRDTNAPVGQLQREFGAEPSLVADKVTEFIEGMHAAGVRTSVKHFPGLGQVETNTDFGVAVDTEVTADGPSLEPFVAAVEAGVDSVMVSSAIFSRIDDESPAVFSEKVITGLLRKKLGYDGVVIADDLGAAKSVAAVDPSQRGVLFIAAGGDIAINADPELMDGMVAATLERVETDDAFAEQVTRSAARVLALKESAGLLTCG